MTNTQISNVGLRLRFEPAGQLALRRPFEFFPRKRSSRLLEVPFRPPLR